MVGMLAALLGDDGHQVVTAYDGEVALRRHSDERPDLVILDRRLPRMAGDVVDRRTLLRLGWPDERDPDPEWLKAHLARLRSKLQEAGAPELANVRGVGYRLG